MGMPYGAEGDLNPKILQNPNAKLFIRNEAKGVPCCSGALLRFSPCCGYLDKVYTAGEKSEECLLLPFRPSCKTSAPCKRRAPDSPSKGEAMQSSWKGAGRFLSRAAYRRISASDSLSPKANTCRPSSTLQPDPFGWCVVERASCLQIRGDST